MKGGFVLKSQGKRALRILARDNSAENHPYLRMNAYLTAVKLISEEPRLAIVKMAHCRLSSFRKKALIFFGIGVAYFAKNRREAVERVKINTLKRGKSTKPLAPIYEGKPTALRSNDQALVENFLKAVKLGFG